jgi:hypothetical protein
MELRKSCLPVSCGATPTIPVAKQQPGGSFGDRNAREYQPMSLIVSAKIAIVRTGIFYLSAGWSAASGAVTGGVRGSQTFLFASAIALGATACAGGTGSAFHVDGEMVDGVPGFTDRG